MAEEIKIPELGESVSEAVIVQWLKDDGAQVEAGEPVLELETEKAAMQLSAESAGILRIVAPAGARVRVGDVVAQITEAAAAPDSSAGPAPATPAAPAAQPSPAPAAPSAPAAPRAAKPAGWRPPPATERRGNGGGVATAPPPAAGTRGDADVERVPMSELRRTLAARLVAAQQTAAILTTVNEIELGDLMAARRRHREAFRARHGVDLGLMSLFSRATVLALRQVPVVNARLEGHDILYHRRVHLGIAVSTRRGLVVPVVRNADSMSVAELERAIGELVQRARDGHLAPDDLAGGTFTITNGGVFGSLLSTPLLNPPQSGILGMHKIEERPIARGGQVVIRPMMYVALSYDHRLVDGEQAVTFLVRVKELLEDPARDDIRVRHHLEAELARKRPRNAVDPRTGEPDAVRALGGRVAQELGDVASRLVDEDEIDAAADVREPGVPHEPYVVANASQVAGGGARHGTTEPADCIPSASYVVGIRVAAPDCCAETTRNDAGDADNV